VAQVLIDACAAASASQPLEARAPLNAKALAFLQEALTNLKGAISPLEKERLLTKTVAGSKEHYQRVKSTREESRRVKRREH
jgi:hypothetical protein